MITIMLLLLQMVMVMMMVTILDRLPAEVLTSLTKEHSAHFTASQRATHRTCNILQLTHFTRTRHLTLNNLQQCMRRRFWPKTASFTFHSTISQDKRHLGFSQFHTGADKTLWLAGCCVACCSKPCETCSEAEEKPPVCHWQCSWSAKITITHCVIHSYTHSAAAILLNCKAQGVCKMLHCIELHCVSCIASVVGDALCGADFTLTAEDIVKIKLASVAEQVILSQCNVAFTQ